MQQHILQRGGQGLNPFDWYRQMRNEHPVFFDEALNCWHVFHFDDVQRVLTEYATFSSDRGRMMGPNAARRMPLSSSIISLDPPRHRQLRNLATVAFTPRRVAQMAERIETITNELLDKVVTKGEMDVIADLAYPLPVTVIAEMLGIPAERHADFKRWSDALVEGDYEDARNSSPEQRRQNRMQDLIEMYSYFQEVLVARRQQPQDDLISSLLAAEVDGEHLNDMELLGFCSLLLVAGNETTTNLIGNAILSFDENPEVIERLRNQPDLMPGAIEEALRYRSPVKSMLRIVSKDTTIRGQQLKEKQMVAAWIASANRDEEQFPNADVFDITREPNRHIAFGHGIHFCLGAPLARLEAKIALNLMLQHLPGLRRVPDVAVEPIRSAVVFGVKNLPVTFQAQS